VGADSFCGVATDEELSQAVKPASTDSTMKAASTKEIAFFIGYTSSKIIFYTTKRR